MNQSNKQVSLYAFIIIIYILLFQNWLQKQIVLFQYADEIFAMSAIIIFFVKSFMNAKNGNARTMQPKGSKVLMIGLGLALLSGLLGSFINRYQPNNIVFNDVLLTLKFFLAIYIGYAVFSWIPNDKRARNVIEKHIKIIITVFICMTLVDKAFSVFPVFDSRYGMQSMQLFYSHPTALVAACVSIVALYYMIFQEKMKSITIMIMCIIIALSLRTKAFGVAMIIIVMNLLMNYNSKKLRVFCYICAIIGIYMLAIDQIQLYYGGEIKDSARLRLNETSMQIAKDYFPLGTGFGTFASTFSVRPYSKVYYLYRLNNVYGLSPGEATFVSDTFWPMIIGQFGWLGTIGYVTALLAVFKMINHIQKQDKYIFYASLISFIYLLISSTSESAFVHTMAVPLGVIIGISIGSVNYVHIRGDG